MHEGIKHPSNPKFYAMILILENAKANHQPFFFLHVYFDELSMASVPQGIKITEVWNSLKGNEFGWGPGSG